SCARRIERVEPVLLVDRLAQHQAPAAALLEEIVEPPGAHHVAQHAVDLGALRDRHLGLRDRARAEQVDGRAAEKMQDAHALLVALLAHPDELVARALEPGRHHAPVLVPHLAEAVPLPRIAQHGPVLDQLADSEAIEQRGGVHVYSSRRMSGKAAFAGDDKLSMMRAQEHSMGRLENRVSIVTGGAKGIGRHYSFALAAQGACVMIADIVDGAEVAAEIAAKHGANSVASELCDVSDESAVKRLLAATIERFGRIDVLVNNAALYAPLPEQKFTEIDAELWDKVMAVNLRGTFLMAK